MDERDMCHHRHVPAQRLVDLGLTRGVGEMVVPADDVGDTHVVVVDHDREHIGGGSIRAQQYQIIEVLVLPDDAALHLIFDRSLAAERRLEPDHRLDPERCVGGIAVPPATIVELGPPFAARLLPHLHRLLGAGIAAIGAASLPAALRPRWRAGWLN